MNKINRDVEFDLENDAKRCIDRAGHPDAGDRGIPADAHKDVLRVTQIFENPHFIDGGRRRSVKLDVEEGGQRGFVYGERFKNHAQ
jgi:hypothetical protein